MRKCLVETGFLLALNPNDKNHGWALDLLRSAKRGICALYISPAAPIELSLIMKSRGYSHEAIAETLATMEDAIMLYTRPDFAVLRLEHLQLAAHLRSKYSELTFFDSIHAAIAVMDNYHYSDLDSVVAEIVSEEGA